LPELDDARTVTVTIEQFLRTRAHAGALQNNVARTERAPNHYDVFANRMPSEIKT
jgi:hypothetical protein